MAIVADMDLVSEIVTDVLLEKDGEAVLEWEGFALELELALVEGTATTHCKRRIKERSIKDREGVLMVV